MAFNINHSLRRTSHEMQTLSNVEKLMEIMEEKMKGYNTDSVELSFIMFKGNTIQSHDAFECFFILILNKTMWSAFNQY